MTPSQSLPTGWIQSTLEESTKSVGGGTPSKADPSFWTGGTIPWISPKDMKVFTIISSEDTLAAKALDRLTLIPKNSVLVVVRSGILSRMLPVATNAVPVTLNQDMRAFIPAAGMDARFIALQLIANERAILHSCAKNGTTVASIEGPALARFPLLIAPAAEQKRIVAKIEELFSDLDAGVAELKAAQKKLARYRQSLLKAAVEGSLTAEWRKQNTPSQTGAQLLERILTERRARWEAKLLGKFKEQGKAPPKDWRGKYPEPVKPDTSGLSVLPEGWVWGSLDMLGEIASGVAKGTKRDNSIAVREVPYLRVANVQRGYLDLSEVKTILATERDIEELTLKNGDVLFNEGGDRDKLGRGWVWRDEVASCIHQNHVFRMRPYLPELLSELVSHHGNTFGKIWFKNAGKQTTNLASINMTMLRTFPVPVGPLSEQRELLMLVQRQIENLDRQEATVELSLRQTAAQRKNILKAAFSGELLPQVPSDESAGVLLSRLHHGNSTREKQVGAS